MSEQGESGPVSVADHLSDRAAGGLLLAFLVAVIVVLAAGTLPLSPDAHLRTVASVVTSSR